MPPPTRATAHASGSIGNLGPGLDVLGAAVVGGVDSVTVAWTAEPGATILDPGHPSLPRDPAKHASSIAALAVLDAARQAGAPMPFQGIALTVHKGLPLSAGQGGSAASAVAGAAATNALLGGPLDAAQLLDACLTAEARVAGRHLDNIAPSLLGGICLVRSVDPIDVIQLPVPTRLRVVLAHPSQELRTADARAVLPTTLGRDLALRQMANVAAIVAALHTGDLALIGRSMTDEIAEPVRAPLLPGFAEAKSAALQAGALGASISGAGPTSFALCDSDVAAQRVSHAMRRAYEGCGVEAAVRVTRIEAHGVRIDVEPLHSR